mmetsp:Transcript_30947/g.28137  ORF Transcript_30947/g.28137 Transcript_30947/m.28137 type:complete len:116 (+) Transcript_30947:707-1054(+)
MPDERLELEAITYIDMPNHYPSESTEDKEDSDDEDANFGCPAKNKRTRNKERKISEVLELVLKWRKFYAGVRDPLTGDIIKLSLDDAAKKLGVAKKSLDDYLLQIRHAKMFGFDF